MRGAALSRFSPMTPKQARFVEEYLIDLNATQAAIRAGYSAKTADRAGPRLLGNVEIAVAIAKAKERRSERVELSAEYVLTRLRENVERSMTAEPVRDSDGSPTGEYVYAGNVANKALELLGKHLGLFTDKLEHSGPGGGPVEITVTRRIIRPSE